MLADGRQRDVAVGVDRQRAVELGMQPHRNRDHVLGTRARNPPRAPKRRRPAGTPRRRAPPGATRAYSSSPSPICVTRLGTSGRGAPDPGVTAFYAIPPALARDRRSRASHRGAHAAGLAPAAASSPGGPGRGRRTRTADGAQERPHVEHERAVVHVEEVVVHAPHDAVGVAVRDPGDLRQSRETRAHREAPRVVRAPGSASAAPAPPFRASGPRAPSRRAAR